MFLALTNSLKELHAPENLIAVCASLELQLSEKGVIFQAFLSGH
jgi:hypothetical protein